MPNGSAQKVVAVALIIVAAVIVLWLLGMWMMPSMMGGMMGGGMMGPMGGWGIYALAPLLFAFVLVVLAVVLLRIKG